MNEKNLVYRIPGARWSLELPSAIVSTLSQSAQRNWFSKESVGQLYSKDLTADVVRVDEVTRLASRFASRTGVWLDLSKVVLERQSFFKKGLHCLGFWHSHPERIPTPSNEDVAMAADQAKAAICDFAGMLFVIVGTAPPPEGIGVWIHDGEQMWGAVHLPHQKA